MWQPSSSSWLHQWLCVSCSRTVQTSEIGTSTNCRAPNEECCHTWSSTVLQERGGVNVASTQLQIKVAIGFLTGLLRMQVDYMDGEKGQSPHQVRAHSLGCFALSSHWHWQFLSVVEESQFGPLVRDIKSLKFKSSFGCHVRDHWWKLSPDTCNVRLLIQSLQWFCRTFLHGLAENISLVQFKRCAFQPTCLSLW